jgi:hypothetical protein
MASKEKNKKEKKTRTKKPEGRPSVNVHLVPLCVVVVVVASECAQDLPISLGNCPFRGLDLAPCHYRVVV